MKMTDMTETQSYNSESKLSLSKNDLIYCFAIILLMLAAFDLMGNFIFIGITIGINYTIADIPILNLILNLGAQIGVVVSFLILYRLRKIEPEEKTSPKGNHFLTTYSLYALNLAFAFFVIINIVNLLEDNGFSTASPYEGIEPTRALLENPLFVPLFFAVIIVGASVSEELVFRRALIPMLERRGLGQAWVLLISSVVFSLRHTPGDFLSGSLGFTIIHLFGTMSGGLILGYLYLRTRNILWPILLHALNNGVAAIGQIISAIYINPESMVVTFSIPLLIYTLYSLITILIGVIVFSYLIIQLVTRQSDMGGPIWIQILTDTKIKSVKLRSILIVTIIFIFFSGGIPFVFDFVESILELSGIVEGTSLGVVMVLIEITYYFLFLIAISWFVFKKAQPIATPIFVPTVISGETKYSSVSTFVHRPVYQQSSGKSCKSCGNAIIPNAKFCAFCGVQHLLNDEELNHDL